MRAELINVAIKALQSGDFDEDRLPAMLLFAPIGPPDEGLIQVYSNGHPVAPDIEIARQTMKEYGAFAYAWVHTGISHFTPRPDIPSDMKILSQFGLIPVPFEKVPEDIKAEYPDPTTPWYRLAAVSIDVHTEDGMHRESFLFKPGTFKTGPLVLAPCDAQVMNEEKMPNVFLVN